MSVIAFQANEVKAIEATSVELCGEHVQGPVWTAMYQANHRAYFLSYMRRDLTDEEMAEYAARYEQAQPKAEHLELSTPAAILQVLHHLSYNLISNGGNRPLTVMDGMEQARRQVLDCVAFECMPPEGSRKFVHLDGFANIRRVDFNCYEIRSHDPGDRHDKPFFIEGKPHPFDGLRTTDPREAFQKVWEMHDECFKHWLVDYEKKMTAWAQSVRSSQAS